MSRVLTVAHRDLRHALGNRLAWGALLLIGLLTLPWTWSAATGDSYAFDDFVLLFPYELLKTAIVLVAAVAYGSVVGERESGTLRMALGLGATRRGVVLGKLLARAAVVVLSLATVLAIASAMVAAGYGAAHLPAFWTMGVWVLLYGAAWTAVVVGYSAAFASQYRVLGATLVTYAAFSPAVSFWSTVVRPVFALLFTGSTASPVYDGLADAPLWLRVTERLNPLRSFFVELRWTVSLADAGTPVTDFPVHAFGVFVFACFAVVPLYAGVRRFERADLAGSGPESVTEWVPVSLPATVSSLGGIRFRGRSDSTLSRVRAIIRADFRRAFSDRVVLGMVALFALLVVPRLWQSIELNGAFSDGRTFVRSFNALALPCLALAMAVGYRAVAGERESGTARMVLGLGATRRELVVGKLLSRVSVVVLVLVPFLIFAELLAILRLGDPYTVVWLVLTCSTLLWAVVWTTVTVGASAALSTRYRALAAPFGTYLFFSYHFSLWNNVVMRPLAFLLTGSFSLSTITYVGNTNVLGPLWFRYALRLNPIKALSQVEVALQAVANVNLTPVTVPLTLFSLAVVLLFAALPVLLGVRRFERADLG